MNQFQAPELSKTNKVILIGAGVCFLLGAILTSIGALNLVQWLGLSGGGISNGLVYQLLTYPLMETQLMGLLFSGLIIWFIGSPLEVMWGSKVYLRFILLVVLGVAILYTLANLGRGTYSQPLHGLSGINFALLTAYAVLYPDRQMAFMMIFPMKARTFCLILAAMEAYFALFTSISSSWPHLFAMGISYLIIRYQTNPLIKSVLNSSFKRSPTKKKGHLYVVKEDETKPPKYWQ